MASKSRNLLSRHLEPRSLKSRCQWDTLPPSEGPKERSLLPLPASGSSSARSWACGRVTLTKPLSSRGHLLCVSLLSVIRTPGIGFRPILSPHPESLNVITPTHTVTLTHRILGNGTWLLGATAPATTNGEPGPWSCHCERARRWATPSRPQSQGEA